MSYGHQPLSTCDVVYFANDAMWVCQPWLTTEEAEDVHNRWLTYSDEECSRVEPAYRIGFMHRRVGGYRLTSTLDL